LWAHFLCHKGTRGHIVIKRSNQSAANKAPLANVAERGPIVGRDVLPGVLVRELHAHDGNANQVFDCGVVSRRALGSSTDAQLGRCRSR